jgi:hypothetical protein
MISWLSRLFRRRISPRVHFWRRKYRGRSRLESRESGNVAKRRGSLPGGNHPLLTLENAAKPLILLGKMKVVAGPGIEPGTQGFSVLLLTVHNFSSKSTSVQSKCGFYPIITAKRSANERTVYDSSENKKWNRNGTEWHR